MDLPWQNIHLMAVLMQERTIGETVAEAEVEIMLDANFRNATQEVCQNQNFKSPQFPFDFDGVWRWLMR